MIDDVMPIRRPRVLLPLVLGCLMAAGCSVRKLAMNSVAGALSGSGPGFGSDDDPQLVREAIPFALKSYESLLADLPTHEGLLVATARGFTQYAYGFLVRDAELLEDTDLEGGLVIRRRARKLLLRGRDYGMRALEVRHPGLGRTLAAGDLSGLDGVTPADVDALFWTSSAWGAAIAVLKDDADLIGDLPVVEAMLRRVIALDETYDRGAAHEVMIVMEAGLAGGSIEAARHHYERAVALSAGHSASVHVSYAENVLVKEQDRPGFEETLARALAVNPKAEPSLTLANVLAQERARWLRGRVDDLFL